MTLKLKVIYNTVTKGSRKPLIKERQLIFVDITFIKLTIIITFFSNKRAKVKIIGKQK